MNWLLPAICSLILWGAGQVFVKKGLSGVSPFVSNLIATLLALLIEIPFALIGGVEWSFFPLIFLFGFFAQIPNFIYPYVLQKSNVSLSGTILAIYPIFTVILSVFFLKETLTILQLLGIAGVILGTVLVAKQKNEKIRIAGWVVWAIIGAVLIGFGDFIGKVAITKFDLYSFILSFTLGGIPSLLLIRFFDRSPLSIKGSRRDLIFSAIGNLVMPLGLLFLFIAFNNGPASLVSPIASSYPALTAVLAYFFLKEKISRENVFGIIIATIGIILIGVNFH